ELARRLSLHRVDAVVGPLVGGAFAAQAVAAELGVDFAFAERLPQGGGAGYRIPDPLARALAANPVPILHHPINPPFPTRPTAAPGLGGQPVVGAPLPPPGPAGPGVRRSDPPAPGVPGCPAQRVLGPAPLPAGRGGGATQ